MSNKKIFDCSENNCTQKVEYDPDDDRYKVVGAAKRNKKPRYPIIVYLTCALGHVRRYEVKSD